MFKVAYPLVPAVIWYSTKQACSGLGGLLVCLIVLQWRSLEAEPMESSVNWKTGPSFLVLVGPGSTQCSKCYKRASSSLEKPIENKISNDNQKLQRSPSNKTLYIYLVFFQIYLIEGRTSAQMDNILSGCLLWKPHSLKRKKCPRNVPETSQSASE